jgi:hypothetical protein
LIPGRELFDVVKANRVVVGTANVGVILVILVYRLLPDFPAVFGGLVTV